MMTGIQVVRILHGGFKLIFLVCLIATVLQLLGEFLTTDGHMRNLSLPHHNNGISLPIVVRISVPDSIVRVEGVGTRKFKKNENSYFKNKYYQPDSLYQGLNVSRHVIKNEVEISSFPFLRNSDDDLLHLTNSDITAKGSITAKFSNPIVNWIYVILNYMKSFILLLILYLISELFFHLKDSFSFTNINILRLKNIGYLFIGYTIFKLAFNYSLVYFNGYIDIKSFENNLAIPEALDIDINPLVEYNWTMLAVGLILIVISSLLRQATLLKSEHDLTI